MHVISASGSDTNSPQPLGNARNDGRYYSRGLSVFVLNSRAKGRDVKEASFFCYFLPYFHRTRSDDVRPHQQATHLHPHASQLVSRATCAFRMQLLCAAGGTAEEYGSAHHEARGGDSKHLQRSFDHRRQSEVECCRCPCPCRCCRCCCTFLAPMRPTAFCLPHHFHEEESAAVVTA